MIGSLIGIFVFGKKKADHKFAKPISVSLFVLLVIASILFISNIFSSGSDYEDVLRIQRSGTYFLGQELAKKMPGARVLIINEVKTDSPNEFMKARIEGLKEGFGEAINDIKVVHKPQPKIIERRTLPNGAEWIETEQYSAKDFNNFLEENSDCNLIITVASLPQDFGNAKILNDFEKDPDNTPKLVLINNDVQYMYPYVKYGLVPALLVDNPNLEGDESVPSSLKECFEKNFILITKENLDQITKKYPNMFMKE